MAKEFFYQVMGEVFGPITGVDLRERAADGDVTTDTLVRIGTDGEWVHARRLKNLFDDGGRAITHEEVMKSLGQTAESLAALRDSYADLVTVLGEVDGYDLTAVRFPHPAFGELNAYQWAMPTG